MPNCVAFKGCGWLAVTLLSVSTAPFTAISSAEAAPKSNVAAKVAATASAGGVVTSGAGAPAASSATPTPTDPLSQLNVSEKTKAHQARADRALAENGESRSDEVDGDGLIEASAPADSQNAKAQRAAVKCLAGCD